MKIDDHNVINMIIIMTLFLIVCISVWYMYLIAQNRSIMRSMASIVPIKQKINEFYY